MENSFKKHIRDTMNDPPEFPFEERLWKDMESRLNGDKKKRKIGGFMIWLPWLLALSASAFAGFIYFDNQSAWKEIGQLKERNQGNQLVYSKIDTIYSKQTLVIYDTTYNSIVINKFFKNENQKNADYSTQYSKDANRFLYPARGGAFSGFFINSNFENFALLSKNNKYGYHNYLHNNTNDGFYKNVNILLQNEGISDSNEKISIKNLEAISNISLLPSLPFSLLNYESEVNFPSIEYFNDKNKEKKTKKRKRVESALIKLKPSSFALSVTAGQSTSLNLEGMKKGKINMGLHTEIGYGRRFSFMIGVEHLDNIFSFELENSEKKILGYPDLPPTNPGDILHKIYGDFEYLQVPFGIKYSLSSNGHLHPYVGVGLISKKAFVSKTRFEYLSIMDEYYVGSNHLLPDVFEINDFYTTIGVHYDLTKRWQVLFEGSSQFRFKPGVYNYEKTRLLKWNAGIKYRFLKNK